MSAKSYEFCNKQRKTNPIWIKAFHVTLRNLTLILKGWGLIDGKLIAIDGTKIRAQNSKHNCITKSGLDKKIAYADEQINAYLMALEKDSLL